MSDSKRWNVSKYYEVAGPAWDEARQNAQNLGGNLVTISSEEENIWLHSAFNISGSNKYWAGFNDVSQEGSR